MPVDEGGNEGSSRLASAASGDTILSTLVSPVIDALRRPGQADIDDVLVTSLALVGVLVVVVPVVVLGVGIPLLIAVISAGVIYGVFCYSTDRIAAGFISSVFVLSIFMANVPLAAGRIKGDLSLYVVDPLVILLLVGLVRGASVESLKPDSTLGGVAVTAASVFVFWSYLAALVGNGPSDAAAVVFAVEQTRYLVLFLVTVLVVRETDVRFALYPLLVSIGGNLLYAVAEGLSGHTLGLTYLGDSDGKLLSEFAVGTVTLQAGYYAGGFVGHTRELIGLLMLLLPFLVFWTVYGERVVAATSVLGIASVTLVVRLGETDAGWFASLLVLALAGFASVALLFRSQRRLGFRGSASAVLGVGTSLFLYRERFVKSSVGGAGSSGGDATGVGTATSSGTGSSVRRRVAEFASAVPGVEIDTLGIRLTQYAAAVDISLTYPLFGIGGYNFVFISQEYGLPAEMGIHNTFFSHLAALGVPGALAYLVSVVAVLAFVGRAVVSATDRQRLFWACLLVGLLGFHAYSFWVVMYGWLAPNAGFWILSGAAVGALGVD